VMVPVVFVNEEKAPGLKKGGVLNIVRHELDLICEADKIPSDIEIDVTGKDVGDSIHISDVTLPQGSESAITDRDFTIATLVAPSALKKAEGAEAVAGSGDAPAAEADEAEGEAEAETGTESKEEGE
jgi:large subunit ribosomal protein L25